MKKIFLFSSLFIFLVTTLCLAEILDLKLPYENGESRLVTLGYLSKPTHVDGTKDKYAIDFAGNGCDVWDQPVLAVKHGKIIRAETGHRHGESRSYGNVVVIDHGGGVESLYGHMNQVLVKVGDEVKQGQQIGTVGNTGTCIGSACAEHPGAHLHFAMHQNGAAMIPEPISGYSNIVKGMELTSDNELWSEEITTPEEPVNPVGGDDELLDPNDPIWHRGRGDATPPTTTVSPQDDAFNYFPVSVTLTAVDPSGIKETWYKLDADDWARGNSFSVTGEGEHTLSYYSVDKFNNWEKVKTKTVTINLSAPYTAINLDQEYYNTVPLNVILTATDAQGILATYARVNGGQFIAQNNFWLEAEGDYTIEYYSKDLLGEEEPVKTRHVVIDLTPPNVNISGPAESDSSDFTLAYDPDDAATWQIEYCESDEPLSDDTIWTPWIDDTVTAEMSYEFTDASRGATYYFHIKGQDLAGNDSGWSEPFAVVVAPVIVDSSSYISVDKPEATADGADTITIIAHLFYLDDLGVAQPYSGAATNIAATIENLNFSEFTEGEGTPGIYTATITSSTVGVYGLTVSVNGASVDKDNTGAPVSIEFKDVGIEPETGLIVYYGGYDQKYYHHSDDLHVDIESSYLRLRKDVEVTDVEEDCWYDEVAETQVCEVISTDTYTERQPQSDRDVTMYIDGSAVENLSDSIIQATTDNGGYAEFDFSFDLLEPDLVWPDFQIKLDSTGQILKEGNLHNFISALPVPC